MSAAIEYYPVGTRARAGKGSTVVAALRKVFGQRGDEWRMDHSSISALLAMDAAAPPDEETYRNLIAAIEKFDEIIVVVTY